MNWHNFFLTLAMLTTIALFAHGVEHALYKRNEYHRRRRH